MRGWSTFPAGRGTTLLELLLVIALLTIAAALSGPLFLQLFQRQGADAAAQTVASRLEQARGRGLLEMTVPAATFTYDSPRFEAAGGAFALEDAWRITWAGGGAGDELLIEFDNLGRLKSRTVPLSLQVQSPTEGPPMSVAVALSGLVSWKAED